MRNTNRRRNQGWTQVLRKGNQFLHHWWHLSCYYYKEIPVVSRELGKGLWLRQMEHIRGYMWHRYSWLYVTQIFLVIYDTDIPGYMWHRYSWLCVTQIFLIICDTDIPGYMWHRYSRMIDQVMVATVNVLNVELNKTTSPYLNSSFNANNHLSLHIIELTDHHVIHQTDI